MDPLKTSPLTIKSILRVAGVTHYLEYPILNPNTISCKCIKMGSWKENEVV